MKTETEVMVAHLWKILEAYTDHETPVKCADDAAEQFVKAAQTVPDNRREKHIRSVVEATWQAGLNELADVLGHHLEYWGGGLCLECGAERGDNAVFCAECLENGISPESEEE